jgi:hypothetical protein
MKILKNLSALAIEEAPERATHAGTAIHHKLSDGYANVRMGLDGVHIRGQAAGSVLIPLDQLVSLALSADPGIAQQVLRPVKVAVVRNPPRKQ